MSYDAMQIDLNAMGLKDVSVELAACVQLKSLRLEHNPIRRLTNLPAGLEVLHACSTELQSFEGLPEGLRELWANRTRVRSLDGLPNGLQRLFAAQLRLEQLGVLPLSLQKLYIPNCGLDRLPSLPHGLVVLNIAGNPFTHDLRLGELKGLETLHIGGRALGVDKSHIMPNEGEPLVAEYPERLKRLHLYSPVRSPLPVYLEALFFEREGDWCMAAVRCMGMYGTTPLGLCHDVRTGRWAAPAKERDRMRIVLDFLSCNTYTE